MKTSRLNVFFILIISVFVYACSSKSDSNDDETLAALLVLSQGFSDNFDGTVSQNNLMWMKCSQGQTWSGSTNDCTGSGGGTTYNAVSLQFCSTLTGSYSDCTTSDSTAPTATSGPAFDSCDTLNFANHTDWRLPTKVELELLVANVNRDAFLNLFPQTPDDKIFWSSTGNKDKSDGSEAAGVNFSESNFGASEFATKDSVKYLRCSRDN